MASGAEGSRGRGRSREGGGMKGGDVATIVAGEDTRNEPPATA